MLRYFVLGIAAGLLALASLQTTEAADGVYLAEKGLSETYAVDKWVNQDSQIPWQAVPSSYQSQFQNVISSWESVLPKTQWTYSTSGDRVKVEVYTTGSRCSSSAVGCFSPKWRYDTTRLGYYLKGADIWINDQNYDFTSNGRLAMVSHEVGHVYGLEDRYPGCRQDEDTIMDAVVFDGQGRVSDSCAGGFYPFLVDIDRVGYFYALWGARDIRATGGAHNWVKWSWYDDNWAESWYSLNNFYWNSVEGYWQYVNESDHMVNVARGDRDDPGDLFTNFYKPSDWLPGYYCMCTYTFSYLRGYAEWSCGSYVLLY